MNPIHFQKYSESVGEKRIINSKHDSINPKSVCQDGQSTGIGKPNGLWYSCGNSWMEWCISESFGIGKFVHEIIIDVSKIKLISDADEFDEFCKEYGLDYFGKLFDGLVDFDKSFLFNRLRRADYIDWSKVAESYAGIEINPYLWKRRLEGGMWYYGWDCASGCIWDASAIKSVKLIAYYDSKKRRVVRCKKLVKSPKRMS